MHASALLSWLIPAVTSVPFVMKRRNVDSSTGKLRRATKRSKISDGYSILCNLKFLLVWAIVIILDFVADVRFELLYPFYVFISNVNDIFKFKGISYLFSYIFVTLTIDMICYYVIPLHWLFFASSTYVWLQLTWYSERGLTLVSILIWIFFIAMEAFVRLREMKQLPFQFELCQPFAAHGIGYPIFTLGIGCKSYVHYRLRLHKKRVVAKENEFHYSLLTKALGPVVDLVELSNTSTNNTADLTNYTNLSVYVASSSSSQQQQQQQQQSTDLSNRSHNIGNNSNNSTPLKHSSLPQSGNKQQQQPTNVRYSDVIEFNNTLQEQQHSTMVSNNNNKNVNGRVQHETTRGAILHKKYGILGRLLSSVFEPILLVHLIIVTMFKRIWFNMIVIVRSILCKVLLLRKNGHEQVKQQQQIDGNSQAAGNLHHHHQQHHHHSQTCNNSTNSAHTTLDNGNTRRRLVSSSNNNHNHNHNHSTSQPLASSSHSHQTDDIDGKWSSGTSNEPSDLIVRSNSGQNVVHSSSSSKLNKLNGSERSSSSMNGSIGNNRQNDHHSSTSSSTSSSPSSISTVISRKGNSSSRIDSTSTTSTANVKSSGNNGNQSSSSSSSVTLSSNDSNANISNVEHSHDGKNDSTKSTNVKSSNNNKNKRANSLEDASTLMEHIKLKDDQIWKLETDNQRLRSDLQTIRQCESDLQKQLNAANTLERSLKATIATHQNDIENLQRRLQSSQTAKQQDKQTIQRLEKALEDERKRSKQTNEIQAACEKKIRIAEENVARANAMAEAVRNVCSDSCRNRQRDIELECATLRKDCVVKDEQIRLKEMIIDEYKDLKEKSTMLMSALSNMHEKNSQLEESFNIEKVYKIELYNMVEESKRQMGKQRALILEQEKELRELRRKVSLYTAQSMYQTQHQQHQQQNHSMMGQSSAAVGGPTLNSLNGYGRPSSSTNCHILSPNVTSSTGQHMMDNVELVNRCFSSCSPNSIVSTAAAAAAVAASSSPLSAGTPPLLGGSLSLNGSNNVSNQSMIEVGNSSHSNNSITNGHSRLNNLSPVSHQSSSSMFFNYGTLSDTSALMPSHASSMPWSSAISKPNSITLNSHLNINGNNGTCNSSFSPSILDQIGGRSSGSSSSHSDNGLMLSALTNGTNNGSNNQKQQQHQSLSNTPEPLMIMANTNKAGTIGSGSPSQLKLNNTDLMQPNMQQYTTSSPVSSSSFGDHNNPLNHHHRDLLFSFQSPSLQ